MIAGQMSNLSRSHLLCLFALLCCCRDCCCLFSVDLPDLLLPRVHSRLGLTKLHFEPYNTAQILHIVQDRLRALPAFGEDAIELCARKIASVSGDIRRALQICRRAAEICEEEQMRAEAQQKANKKGGVKTNVAAASNAAASSASASAPAAAPAMIGEGHILRAIADLQNSNYIQYLSRLASPHDKLLLSGMLTSIKYASGVGAEGLGAGGDGGGGGGVGDSNPAIPLLTLVEHTERNIDARGVRRALALSQRVPVESYPRTSVEDWARIVQQWAEIKLVQIAYQR